ncbi:hypothetical protein I4U23_023051 [Adineta vaga]|nr:hypothetical protein I4U23_023051 [Adineta vaga]
MTIRTSELADMPISGQQSILNAQGNNGTGVVMTEWKAFQVFNEKMICFVSSYISIMNISLLTSFTTSVTLSYSLLDTPKNDTMTVATCTNGGGRAVIVTSYLGTAGRIIQIAYTSHYKLGTFNWE